MSIGMSRRELLVGGAATAAALSLPMRAEGVEATPLEEVRYEQVAVRGARQAAQRENVLEITMGLNEDSLLKPFREMCGAAGPGVSLGGWYEWRPEYDYHHDDAGLAPGATFGQWMSALARFEAASRFEGGAGAGRMGARVERLNGLLGATLTSSYFAKTRFAGYSYDKLVCRLMDAQRLLGDGAALGTLDRVTAAAVPVLPGRAVDREYQWKMVRMDRGYGMRRTRCRRICTSSRRWGRGCSIGRWRRLTSMTRVTSSRSRGGWMRSRTSMRTAM